MRNHIICRIFREAGYIEKLGSGFLTVFQSYRDYHLQRPRIIEGTGYVKCILPRPAVKNTVIMLTEYEEKIMQLFDRCDEISPQYVIETLNSSRQTVARALSKLVGKKLLIRQGAGRTTRYSRI